MSIVFVPVYVKLIGVESYGLVAFSSTLIGTLSILDMGLSAGITRQTAIYNSQNNKHQSLCDLIFSVEILNWAIAIIAGVLIILLAMPISIHWVNAKELSIETIRKCVMLMGIMFALQFPVSVYDGVMIGMEKQIPNAVINLIFTLLRIIGAILILKYVSAGIVSFFVWQVIITLLITLSEKIYVKFLINKRSIRPIFSIIELKVIWKFAAGMTGLSLITFFLAQIDKIIVSKFLLLEFVGYYSLAFSIASLISQVVAPFQSLVYPKLTSLIAQNKQADLILLYHKSCRWISIIIFPIGFSLIFFAKELLFFWSKNKILTENTYPILQVVALGTICNCLLWVPYWFMLAKGNTKFPIYQNIIASIVLVPLLFWWTSRYGALGASFVWLTVNAGYVLITIPVFHTLYLKGELWHWYKNNMGFPFILSLTLVGIAKYMQAKWFPGFPPLPMCFVGLSCCVLYSLIIPDLRQKIRDLSIKNNA